MDSPALDLEALLARRGWLHALARELAGEGGDDLLQEAAVAALSGTARPRTSAESWFAGLLRHLARRERRRSARRPALGAPEPRDPTPPTENLLARAELLERLSAAVRELREPYRTTVLLHFFEGHTLEEVARRTGVPGSTARTRLARALAELRERLDREHGDRATWMLVLFGPALAGGGLLVWPWLAAAAILALSAFGIREWRDTESGMAPSEPAPTTAIDTASSSGSPSVSVETRREALESFENESVTSLALTCCNLAVHVVDARGLAIGHNTPVLTLEREGQRKFIEHADLDGRIRLEALSPGTWTLRCGQVGYRSLEREIQLDEAEEELELVLEDLWRIEIFAFTPDGKPLRNFLLSLKPALTYLPVATSSRPPEIWPEVAAIGSDTIGVASMWGGSPWWDPDRPGMRGTLMIEAPPPVFVGLAIGERMIQVRPLVGGETSVEFVVNPAEIERLVARVRGRIVARDGSAFSGYIRAIDHHGGTEDTCELDSIGSFSLRLVPSEYRLLLREGTSASFLQVFHVGAGQTLDLGDIVFDPDEVRATRVVDPEGEPVAAGFALGLELTDGELRWTDGSDLSSDEQGRLVLPGAGPQHMFLRTRYRSPRAALPLVSGLIDLGTRAAPLLPSEIHLERACQLTLVRELAPSDARWELRTEREGWTLMTRELATSAGACLPAGRYTFLLRAADGTELQRRTFTLGPEGLELTL